MYARSNEAFKARFPVRCRTIPLNEAGSLGEPSFPHVKHWVCCENDRITIRDALHLSYIPSEIDLRRGVEDAVTGGLRLASNAVRALESPSLPTRQVFRGAFGVFPEEMRGWTGGAEFGEIVRRRLKFR